MGYKDEVNDRFILACEFLIEQGYAENKTNIAEKLNISNSKLSEILNRRMKPGIPEIQKLHNFFGVSFDYIFNGQPNILEKKSENFSQENLRPKSPPKISAQSENVRAKCKGNLTPQLEPKQYDPNDGLMHDFEADPISDQKRMDTLGLLVERLQQEVKVLKQEVASRDAIIEAKNEVITTQKEAISIATNQLSAATAAMENVAVYLNKGSKKPSIPPAAPSASDVDASG